MAALLPITRKRSRSSDEEEFLPLSKKINNLHINQWQAFKAEAPPVCDNNVVQQQNWTDDGRNSNPAWTPHCNAVASEMVKQQQPPHSWPPAYAPDLTAAENPFYFENNRLLYELFLSRMNRGTF